MVTDWTEFGLRSAPRLSGRDRVTELSPLLANLLDDLLAAAEEPLRGITSDSVMRPGLTASRPSGLSTAALTEAAEAFLESVSDEQRQRAVFPVDAAERRKWFNIHPNVLRHGLMLEDLSVTQRQAALELVARSLSERGFAQARAVMRINGLLSEITGRPDEYGEWPYWISFFGDPSAGGPWGWQLDGHHLNLHLFVVGDHVAFTPAFMGSEPCRIDSGDLAGVRVFEREQHAGVELMRSLDAEQRAVAVSHPSILPNDLPPELRHPIDGRMRAGAFTDNLVLGYEGLAGDELSDAQRALLRRLIASYVGWVRDDHAAIRMAEVDEYLDETHLLWMGRVGDDGPFYYRVHSPVVLIEFDHHPGIVFDNIEPSAHHIHTVVRTPNGGDYGHDLLARHHQHYDHAGGGHTPRS